MKNLLLGLLFVLMSVSYSSAATTVVLSWDAPSDTDLAGYKVYYGNSSGVYGTPIDIPNPTTVTYNVTNLPDGAYFFTVTAYDTGNRESGYAPECSQIIDTTAPNPPSNFTCGF